MPISGACIRVTTRTRPGLIAWDVWQEGAALPSVSAARTSHEARRICVWGVGELATRSFRGMLQQAIGTDLYANVTVVTKVEQAAMDNIGSIWQSNRMRWKW